MLQCLNNEIAKNMETDQKKYLIKKPDSNIYTINGHTHREIICLNLDMMKRKNVPVGIANVLEDDSLLLEEVIRLTQFVAKRTRENQLDAYYYKAAKWLKRLNFPLDLINAVLISEEVTLDAINFFRCRLKSTEIRNAKMVAHLIAKRKEHETEQTN